MKGDERRRGGGKRRGRYNLFRQSYNIEATRFLPPISRNPLVLTIRPPYIRSGYLFNSPTHSILFPSLLLPLCRLAHSPVHSVDLRI